MLQMLLAIEHVHDIKLIKKKFSEMTIESQFIRWFSHGNRFYFLL